MYCGTGSKGDTHSVWGSRDGKEVGIVERRGGDSEADLRSEIASATPWTSANLQPSQLLAEAGGHSGITSSTGGGGDDGGCGMLEVETGVGSRCVRTS